MTKPNRNRTNKSMIVANETLTRRLGRTSSATPSPSQGEGESTNQIAIV
ncbi:MAG: hypothetical protein IIC79_03035 [Chloroflexi bacterium]|nr:hypothetical protein [Chloroflexota bacterium]